MRVTRVLLLGTLGTVGCGGGGGLGRPVAEFPSNTALQEVASRPAKPLTPLATVDVDRWQLETPVAAADATYPNETSWDQRLSAAVAGRGNAIKLSKELRCAAQETARFYVQHGGYPDDGLRRYMVTRCGSTLPAAGFQTVTSAVPDATSDAEVEQGLSGTVATMLDKQLRGGTGEAGLAYARGNGRAAVVLYYGVAHGHLRGFSPLVQGNSVTLNGELGQGAAVALGLVNQGSYGVKYCDPDRSLKLPAFRITCPLSEQDQQARIEIVTRKPNQVLMNLDMQVLVRRSDDAGLTYEASSYGTSANAANTDAFKNSLLEALNGARAQAGVRPLALETNQSRTNERLVPHFFDGMFNSQESTVETVALGLLAGWDVGGMIRDSGIFSGVVTSSRNPSRWLTYSLESPLGRWVLLDPGMSRIAVGVGALAPSGAMALVTTYAFFENNDHRSDETAVFEELARVRKARGLGPARRMASEPAIQTALAKISINAETSGDALKEALDRLVNERQRSVAGWVIETNDLKQLEFGDSLLGAGSPEIEVGVTHYKAPGGAWGQYAVLFAVFDDGTPTRTARGKAPRSVATHAKSPGSL
jgi:hypothetical protein